MKTVFLAILATALSTIFMIFLTGCFVLIGVNDPLAWSGSITAGIGLGLMIYPESVTNLLDEA